VGGRRGVGGRWEVGIGESVWCVCVRVHVHACACACARACACVIFGRRESCTNRAAVLGVWRGKLVRKGWSTMTQTVSKIRLILDSVS
jgi:hypothetical protein